MFTFYVLRRRSTSKQTELFPSNSFLLSTFSSLQRSFKTSHILALLFGHFSSIRFEIFSCSRVLLTYINISRAL